MSVKELPTWQRLIAGATAGVGYWVCTYPLDVVKARMQAVPYEERSSWMTTARSIHSQLGWRGFLRGLGPCAWRAVPVNAALFTTYDYSRAFFIDVTDEAQHWDWRGLAKKNRNFDIVVL